MSRSYYGFVFVPNDSNLEVVSVQAAEEVRYAGRPKYAVGEWLEYEYVCPKPVRQSDALTRPDGPPYRYKILARQREEFTIIVSEERIIVDNLLDGLWKGFGLRRFGISTHSLVLNIIERGFKMHEGTGAMLVPCITFLYVRTAGYYPKIEWATFQGRDLSIAKMVTEHKQKVVFNRCGLRVPGEKYERARLAIDGAIDFHENALHAGATKRGGTHIEELLLVLLKGGYMLTGENVIR